MERLNDLVGKLGFQGWEGELNFQKNLGIVIVGRNKDDLITFWMNIEGRTTKEVKRVILMKYEVDCRVCIAW